MQERINCAADKLRSEPKDDPKPWIPLIPSIARDRGLTWDQLSTSEQAHIRALYPEWIGRELTAMRWEERAAKECYPAGERSALVTSSRPRKIPPELRFWRLVDASGGPDACWLWKGATSQKGSNRYGSFRTDAGMVPAHRFALGTTGADMSKVPEAMHDCDVPLCCNPKHLKPGDKLQNMQDCARKGRLKFCRCGARRLQHSGHDHAGPCEKTGCDGFVAKGAS